jgi:hypothetical protein
MAPQLMRFKLASIVSLAIVVKMNIRNIGKSWGLDEFYVGI